MSIATLTFRLDDRMEAEGWSIERFEDDRQCFNCLGAIVGGDYSVRSPRAHDYHIHCAIEGCALISYDDDQQPSTPPAAPRADRSAPAEAPAKEREEAMCTGPEPRLPSRQPRAGTTGLLGRAAGEFTSARDDAGRALTDTTARAAERS